MPQGGELHMWCEGLRSEKGVREVWERKVRCVMGKSPFFRGLDPVVRGE